MATPFPGRHLPASALLTAWTQVSCPMYQVPWVAWFVSRAWTCHPYPRCLSPANVWVPDHCALLSAQPGESESPLAHPPPSCPHEWRGSLPGWLTP